MRILYARRAERDLAGIVAFLKARNVHAALVVAATIRRRVALLGRHPRGGRAQDSGAVRKAVTSPFGYILYYSIDEGAKAVVVLSIQRPAADRSPGEESA